MYIGFEVLTAVTVKSTYCLQGWDTVYCLHLQGSRLSQASMQQTEQMMMEVIHSSETL
jgi:hypothetical protein